MIARNTSQEPRWVIILKAILLSVATGGYLAELAGYSSLVLTALVTLGACLLGPFLMQKRLRIPWVFLACLLGTVLLLCLGVVTAQYAGTGDFFLTIASYQTLVFCGLFTSFLFFTRSLSQNWRFVQILELGFVIGTVGLYFWAHRDLNILFPREFTDYAYTNGKDPIELMRLAGAVAALIAFFQLIKKTTPLKLMESYAFLILFSLLFLRFAGDAVPLQIIDPANAEAQNDNDEQSKASDNNNDSENENDSGGNGNGNNNSGGNNNSSNKNQLPNPNNDPIPVAISVFYDDFEPSDGYFHYRQSVLSKYNGNHLVTSEEMDRDVIFEYPLSQTLYADSPQEYSMHSLVTTKMYLLQSHPTPPQLSHAVEVSSINNPDPRKFVSAYEVKSYGAQLSELRYLGRKSIPASWDEKTRQHYLAIPDDPRYKALSDIIVRDIDLRLANDDIMKALAIRSWLEKNGFYTLKVKHIDEHDPTASFLFGSLRGYCVHFAHAAVFLMRSQGIAARVAVGYLVDNRLRGINSAVLIFGDQAHAWPEIFVDGVGWVTFDIAPEQSDAEPRPFVVQDLETMFGELSRGDKSAGKAEEPLEASVTIPWDTIGITLVLILLGLLLVAYGVKVQRLTWGRLAKNPKYIHWICISTLEFLAMLMFVRKRGETPIGFARRLFGKDSHLERLFAMQQASMRLPLSVEEFALAQELAKKAKQEAFEMASVWNKMLGILNPVTWCFSRCITWLRKIY